MTDDPRTTCTQCLHYRGDHCHTPVAAGLVPRYGRAEIGPTLAELPQHCSAAVDRVCTYCGQGGHRAHACPRRANGRGDAGPAA